MANSNIITELNPSEYQELLRTLYEEAWKQYSHEDNLFQSRNTIFLSLQTALIAILTGVSASLISLISSQPIAIRSLRVQIGFGALGLLVIVFAVFGFLLTQVWERLTHAARAYLSLRLSTARIIELQLGLDELGLVGIENRWSDWSKENQEQISRDSTFWYPSGFEDTSGKQYEIRPRPKAGGFDAHLRMISFVRRIWYFFIGIGVFILGITLLALIQ